MSLALLQTDFGVAFREEDVQTRPNTPLPNEIIDAFRQHAPDLTLLGVREVSYNNAYNYVSFVSADAGPKETRQSVFGVFQRIAASLSSSGEHQFSVAGTNDDNGPPILTLHGRLHIPKTN